MSRRPARLPSRSLRRRALMVALLVPLSLAAVLLIPVPRTIDLPGLLLVHPGPVSVQSSVAGQISVLAVENGQLVSRGEVLLVLATERIDARLATLVGELETASVEFAVQQALVTRLGQSLGFKSYSQVSPNHREEPPPPAPAKSAPAQEMFFSQATGAGLGSLEAAANDTVSLRVDRSWAAHEQTLDGYRRQRARLEAERNALQAAQPAREALTRAATARHEALAALHETGRLAPAEWAVEEQAAARRELERLEASALLADVTQRLAVLAGEREALLRNRFEAWEDDLRQRSQRLSLAHGEQDELEARRRAMRVTAPLSGRVEELTVSAVGEVLMPGQKLARIVPTERHFRISAQLPERYKPDLVTVEGIRVAVDALPSAEHGRLKATLRRVSEATLRVTVHGQSRSVFALTLDIEEEGKRFRAMAPALASGMGVTVALELAPRRLGYWWFAPLWRALRD